MDPSDADWNGWEIGDNSESNSLMDPFTKEESPTVVSGDGGRLDTMYDTNIEGEEPNFSFDNEFESYEEMSESMSDEEVDEATENVSDQTTYRFMNGNDGMATCERCGAVGIKHAFYSKSKRFCSLACSKATGDYEKLPPVSAPKKPIAMKKQKSGKFIRQRNKQANSKQAGGTRSFDWGSYILGSHAESAPVSCFKHVPLSDGWDNITIGMKVETRNFDCDLPNIVYWIATVMKIAGYKALLRYEGFSSSDGHKDFWINLCDKDVHPVGWCATSGKPLVPPKTIQHKYTDWKDYLVKRLTGSRTLPSNFYSKVQEGITDHKFRKGMHVEVVNRMCVSAMRVATVEEVIGGRLRLHYDDAKEEGDEFWCHRKSGLLHPVGWAQQVGHKLNGTPEYKSQCLSKITMQKYDSHDATPDMFPRMKEPPEGYRFQVGMKLEAIDPLNLSAICVATVMKVLKYNYLMIGIDGSIAQNGSDWFCYHATSPCIFPVGFCEVNGLSLTPPRGYKAVFKWYDYLKHTRSIAAPVKLFDKEIPKHGFKAGLKLEAVDLMEPRLICVATIARVVGRLLRIHFDGWESEYDQWVDCESPDLYPVGWCEVMKYNVEGPRLKTEVPVPTLPSPQHNANPKKRKGKTQIYKGPRKKRKPKTPLTPPPSIKSMSSQFDIMRHRLLNTRPEEVTERPQEVPQASDLVSDVFRPSLVKTEPVETVHQVPSSTPVNQSTPAMKAAVMQAVSQSSTDIKPVLSTAAITKPTPNKTITTSEVTNNLLAGHLTGTLSLKISNSGLVPTTRAGPTTVTSGLTQQPRVVFGGTAVTSVPETQTLYLTQRQQAVPPEEWSVLDVCHFLKYNDCSAYVELFHRKNISGEQLMSLTKEQIVSLTGMKVGSSLKIYELIQVLRNKVIAQKMMQKSTL